jgi:hypothetical protein
VGWFEGNGGKMSVKIVSVQWALDTRTPVGVVWCAVSSPEQAKIDKVSLPMQEELGVKWMTNNSIPCAVILRVDGHSRSDAHLIRAIKEFRDNEVTAYDDFTSLFENKLITWLWAYAHNRLGRSNTQHSFVVENTVINGGQIFLHQGGEIDRGSLRGHIAIGGFESTTYIDQMVERTAAARPKVLAGGLPMARPFWTHKVVFDDRGKRQSLVLNDKRMHFMNALIDLFLEGKTWLEIPALLKDMGYTTPTGKPYNMSQLQNTLKNPAFWGHTGTNYKNKKSPTRNRMGAWVWDESIPVPDGIILYRNTIPPVVTGERAERVKDELRRRALHAGHAGSASAKIYNNLIVCSACGRNCVDTASRGKTRYYSCHIRSYDTAAGIAPCGNRKWVPYPVIHARIDDLMKQCLDEDIFADNPDVPVDVERELKRDIQLLETRIATLIGRQADNPDVADLYEGQIKQLGTQRETKRRELNRVMLEEKQHAAHRAQREGVITTLRSLDLSTFWDRPHAEINQFLLRLFGNWRLVLWEGRVDTLIHL